MRSALLITALALLSTACAHHKDAVNEHHEPAHKQVVEVERIVEVQATEPAAPPMARPDASYERRARWGARTMKSDQAVTIPVTDHGLSYRELFQFVSEQTGVRIRYEEQNATIKSRKVFVTGPTRVAKDDLLAWFQDACGFDNLVAAPFGPTDRREWVVVDLADPNVSRLVQSVDEDDLPQLAGRSGMYVTAVLSIPEGLDASRVRNALSQNATRMAGLGRVMDVDKTVNAVMVTDFASVVAGMRRSLDDMAIELYEQSQR